MNLINFLQTENPDVVVRGLILMDPVGLYEQEPRTLVTSFMSDAMAQTPVGIAKKIFSDPSLIKKGLQASSDIIFNIMREIRSSGTDYFNKLRTQVSEMAKANENYQAIRCPVVLIQGAAAPGIFARKSASERG